MILWQRFGSLVFRFREETVFFYLYWLGSCWKVKFECVGQDLRREAIGLEEGDQDEVMVFI